MKFDWNDTIKKIKAKDADELCKKLLIKSVQVLKKELGDDWSPDEKHPLLWRIEIIHVHPSGWAIPILAHGITKLKVLTGTRDIACRIKATKCYAGVEAELVTASMLAESGYELTYEAVSGKKRPDFLCKKNGIEFLVEVKALEMSEREQRIDQTLLDVAAACSPMTPVGIIFECLTEPLTTEIKCRLKKAAKLVTPALSQEVYEQGVLKIYLVHKDDPNRTRKYDEWCSKQKKMGRPHEMCGGLSHPNIDQTERCRIKNRIHKIMQNRQIPDDRVGVPFIFSRFIVADQDIEEFANDIIKTVHRHPNILAVVLIGAIILVHPQEQTSITEEKNYIKIDHILAPGLKEQVLILRNEFCNSLFDYNLLKDIFVKNSPPRLAGSLDDCSVS